MLKIIKESKKTNVKDLEVKGYGREIRLCEYDIDNDGIKRYCVVDIRNNKVEWADSYDEAKQVFDNYKLRKRPNDVYFGENAYDYIFQAFDTYAYRYSDECETDEIPQDMKSPEGITYRDFCHAEAAINKGSPDCLIRLSRRDKEVITEVLEMYTFYGSGKHEITKELYLDLARVFRNFCNPFDE